MSVVGVAENMRHYVKYQWKSSLLQGEVIKNDQKNRIYKNNRNYNNRMSYKDGRGNKNNRKYKKRMSYKDGRGTVQYKENRNYKERMSYKHCRV